MATSVIPKNLASDIEKNLAWGTGGNQLRTSVTDYADSIQYGTAHCWASGSDATVVGLPIAQTCYLDIETINPTTAYIIATPMSSVYRCKYMKKKYGSPQWDAWQKLTDAWEAGDSVTISQGAGHCFGRVTGNGAQGYMTFYLGKPISADNVSIAITNGNIFGPGTGNVSAQTATVQGVDKSTGAITFTFNLSSALTGNALLAAELGMTITFS